MPYSAAKHMVLTVTYFSHSQQLQPLPFLKLRKRSGSKKRGESRQVCKGAGEKKKRRKH